MAGPRNQGYAPLVGEQIRETFADRTLAANGHAPMRFSRDGRIEGSREANAWSVEADALCLQGAERACYDVWIKGRSVQMFAGENESEGSMIGVLQ
jgi:hypothetical protein